MPLKHPHRNAPLPLEGYNNPLLVDVVEENVHKIIKIRQESESNKVLQDHIADWLTRFSGTMTFAYIHAVWFIAWVLINVGWTPLPKFDPFPFGLLTLIVSLEAIFLSTFVLISQNRQAVIA